MKVGQISVCEARNINTPRVYRYNQPMKELPPKDGVEFKGKFGAWVGGILGSAAVITTALVAAPATICLLGAGAVLGAAGGDATEDAVNGQNDNDNNN